MSNQNIATQTAKQKFFAPNKSALKLVEVSLQLSYFMLLFPFSVTKRKEGSGPFYILFKGRGIFWIDWEKAVYWLLFALANTSYKTILCLTERSNPCMVIRLTALLYIDLM